MPTPLLPRTQMPYLPPGCALALRVCATLVCLGLGLGQAGAQSAPAPKPAPKAPPKAAPKAAPQNAYAVKAPTNPAELLANLRHALTNRLLLADRFYEDANLLRFFGARQAQWHKLPRPFLKNGKLVGMGSVFAAPEVQGQKPQEVSVSILLKTIPKDALEKRRALIGMDLIPDPRANVDALIQVFGDTASISDTRNSGADPQEPATHRLGNRLITYTFDSPASTAVLNARVNADGGIASIIISEEQKEWSIAPLVAAPVAAPPRP